VVKTGQGRIDLPCRGLLLSHVRLRNSGVVSGTTVRALVLGRFSQKKLKIELKDNAKNE